MASTDVEMRVDIDPDRRWEDLYRLLSRPGPSAGPNFFPGDETKELLHNLIRVLVVGAGGLGCELLKDLTLLGFLNIDVIDMDTIEVTNLNRQFLFRKCDVGQSKAVVAANFINKRVPGASVTPHFCKIQEKDADFYQQFQIIVLGLDSLEARRWMNDMVCSLAQFDDDGNIEPGTNIPMVDGGTEGLAGHVNVIYPFVTPCFECILPLFPPQVNFPMCTLADIPRTPAHCVEWAKQLEWDRVRPFGDDTDLECDDPKHMQWLYETALKRAQQFGIEGVTLKFTQGVAKRIIPAIAATNAIVAAACANEVLKLATAVSRHMSTESGGHYMMYQGGDAIYTNTLSHERKDDCPVCGRKAVKIHVHEDITVAQLIELMKEDSRLRLKNPAISVPADTTSGMKTIYNPHVKSIYERTRENLDHPISSWIRSSGVELTVDDPVMATQKQVLVMFS
ncbi:hypothetical protein GUITHDRAFT_111018 [Guillardia theta CCMP2712]|uniref:NEDD8-activating enzyme E1 catalytic subunit n=1 Tax=Guillardia theta (strain CCMP2712) TaxID=905079 RepID=L1J4A6_GUITC|nr:hypothetical protein GUITHDRAFT_111018 [Guillardia theta CCMP2712]EKX42969.1 hypothetical protein GUITHDRAFT_111018 [Guillardia theta CCMP2712]|eukprot:XP_005829949.1 hypothetical protein GUITHDRAFT_111018 [Guillardia theta CCMP2712]